MNDFVCFVDQHIQAGDSWLIKFVCNVCNKKCFTGYKNAKCENCLTQYNVFNFDNSNRKILVGSYRKAKGGLRKKQIQDLLSLQEYKCAYCFACLIANEVNIEHITPLAVGGTNTNGNLVASCKKCNGVASSLYFKDFTHKRNYIMDRLSKASSF